MTTPVDNAARRRATTELDTTFFVEAAAGTGKTTTLVARIVAIVAGGRARLSEIVAITFTEKAAGELKQRLREQLEKNLAAAKLAEALRDLDRAQITTIHAFCAAILRERPVEARVDPQFAVADDLQRQLVLDAAWAEWLEGELTKNPGALRQALLREVRMEQIKELATLLVDNRSRFAMLPWPAPQPVAVRAVFRQLTAALPALAAGLNHSSARSETFYQRAQAVLDVVPQLEQASDERAVAVLTALELSEPRRQADFDSPENFREFKATIKELKALLTDFATSTQHNFLVELAGWLQGFVADFQQFKHRQALLDFDDLLEKARDLLRTDAAVLRQFQQRYRFLLVDEFQDTDPVQSEIVVALGGNVPGKLFVVGDPKQSIYGFRRADIEMYAGTRDALAQAGATLQFRQNFRSQATIITWVNEVFAKIFQPTGFQPAYIQLEASHPPAGKVVVLRPKIIPDKQSVGAARRAEAQAIAGYLQRQVRDKQFRWGDVALLFRSFTGIEVFSDAFVAAGVPYRIIGGRGYYQRQEIQTLIALLCCLDNPTDKLNLIAVLRSPLFGWTDEQVFLTNEAGGLNYLSTGGRAGCLQPAVGSQTVLSKGLPEEAETAYKLLRELHAGRHDQSVPALLERVFAATHICQAFFACGPDGPASVANLLKALELARRVEAAGIRSLRGFVRQLRATLLNGLDEEPAPASELTDDVVCLLTMHKAKGLEFPVVVLADLAGQASDSGARLVANRAGSTFELRFASCRTADFDGGNAEQSERDEAEEIRLLYVAATRARRRLIVPWFANRGERLDLLKKGFEPVASDLVEVDFGEQQLVGALAENGKAPTSRVGRDAAVVCGKPAVARDGKAVTSHRTPNELLVQRAAWQAERAALLARAVVPAVRVSPSKLAHETAPHEEELVGGTRAAAMELGVVVHEALERMDATGLPDEARQWVERALRSDLLKRVGQADEVYRELPVTAGTLEGKIDLLFREGKKWVLVDYKTDAQPDAERYRAQMQAYATALRQVAGIAVAEQWLFFLKTGEMVSVA